MKVTKSDPIFLNSVNAEGEVRRSLKTALKRLGAQNIIQIITDNASACKIVGAIMESKYPYIFYTLCIVHTPNLVLKNIFAAKNKEANVVTYAQCS